MRQYELIPSQKTMVYMLKYSLHKQVTNVPTSFAVERKLDFALLRRALETEIERNDCLRLHFVKTRQGIRQSFLPDKPLGDVPVLHFRNRKLFSTPTPPSRCVFCAAKRTASSCLKTIAVGAACTATSRIS